MKMVLYIDGCVLRETSRTEKLAQAFLRKRLVPGDKLETVVLEEVGLSPLDGAAVRKRDKLIAAGDFSDGYFRYAKMFADADEVVIAVPYWDMSFPALLKMFLEHLGICGLTFRYSEQGKPEGLTKIKRVTYLTTAGGFIGKRNFGFDYVQALMRELYGIADIRFISAEGLDIAGNDPQAILDAAIRALPDD